MGYHKQLYAKRQSPILSAKGGTACVQTNSRWPELGRDERGVVGRKATRLKLEIEAV